MAFSSGNDSGGPMAEINVTPLVDVMLVLLIIFMITTPLMNHKVKVQLPEAVLDKKPDEKAGLKTPPVTIAVTEKGELFWNDEPSTRQLIESKLSVEAQKDPAAGRQHPRRQDHQVPVGQRRGEGRPGPGHAQGRVRRRPAEEEQTEVDSMAFSIQRRFRPMADINVTPLVDVMLVLLIIFMVTMPIQSVPVDVDLPQKTLNPPEAEGTAGSDQACASMLPARCSGTTRRHR
jgi:biopolymer transport protein ExbD